MRSGQFRVFFSDGDDIPISADNFSGRFLCFAITPSPPPNHPGCRIEFLFSATAAQ